MYFKCWLKYLPIFLDPLRPKTAEKTGLVSFRSELSSTAFGEKNWLVTIKEHVLTWRFERNTKAGGRKGLRWCGFALFLVRFCGNFRFNSRYCGFKTLSGLRLLQPLSHGFRWKKMCAVITLFRTVGRRSACGCFAKCFVLQRIRVHYISLQVNSVVCN